MGVEPHEVLATFRKRWWAILAFCIVGFALSFALAKATPTSYESHSSVFVSSPSGDTTAELVQGSTFSQQIVQSYAQLATTPAVLQPAIDKLGLNTTPDALAKTVTATTPLNTVIINISVVNGSPHMAANIANAVADSLATTAESLSPKRASGSSGISIVTVAPAEPAKTPSAPNTRLIYSIGILVGLIVGMVLAIVVELFDTRIREDADVARASELPAVGRITRNPRGVHGIVMRMARRTPTAEDYRRLRTNLAFADVDAKTRSILVTSPAEAVGKTTTALNLALAMAEAGTRGLVIDADLRRPSIAEYCQIEGDVGLTSVLIGSARLEDAIQHWGGVIDVLPSGLVPPNPTRLLASDAMAALVGLVTAEYDFVILDSPPILPVGDGLALAQLVDGVLIVARHNLTRRGDLLSTARSLEAVNSVLLGVVLNAAPRGKKSSYYSYARNRGAAADRALAVDELPVSASQIGRRRRASKPRQRPAIVPEGGSGSSGYATIATKVPSGFIDDSN